MRDKEGLKEDKAPGEKAREKNVEKPEERRAGSRTRTGQRTAGGRQQVQ